MRYSFWNKRRLLEFFLVGFCIGVVEDIIVVGLLAGVSITWSVLGAIAGISFIFAFINEYVTDHPSFWNFLFPHISSSKLMQPKYQKTMRYIEFFIIGVIFAIVENIIVLLIVGGSITFDLLIAMFFIALPFAYFSEMVVDHPSFISRLRTFKDTLTRYLSPDQK